MLVIQPRASAFLHQPKFVCYFFFSLKRGSKLNHQGSPFFQVPCCSQVSGGHKHKGFWDTDKYIVLCPQGHKSKPETGNQLEWSKKHTNQAEAFRAYSKAAASCKVQKMQREFRGLCQPVSLKTWKVTPCPDGGQVRPHREEFYCG